MNANAVDMAREAAAMRDPAEGLAAVAALRQLLSMLEAANVDAAVRAGWSWSEIADALGVSRQAVHKKHAKRLKAAAKGTRRRTT